MLNTFKLSWLLFIILSPFLANAQKNTEKADIQTAESSQYIKWKLDFREKGFDLRTLDDPAIALEGVNGAIEINGKPYSLSNAKLISSKETITGQGPGRRVEYLFPEINCRWIWNFVSLSDGVEISAIVKNVGKTPLLIENWNVVSLSQAQSGRFTFGSDPGNARFFRWHTWDMRVELLESGKGRHSSENLCLLVDPVLKQSFMAAFLTMDRMRSDHSLRYSPENGIEEYKATCRFGKYELRPKQELVSEKLHISFQKDPYKALENWADVIYQNKKPVFADLPPVGLSGVAWVDTWNEHEGGYAEVSIENIKAFRNKFKGFDADIFRISTLNSLKDGIPGNWKIANERHFAFTNGYENFIKELNKYGLKAGVWVSPFWFAGEADGVLKNNQENLLRDCNGKIMSERLNWSENRDDTTRISRLNKYWLDGTHPKTGEYLKDVFAYNRKIGVRFYMLDFLDVPKNSCLYDRSKTPLEAAGTILKMIRKTTGDDTHLQTAVSSTPAYSSIINAARVGRDYGESRPLQSQGTPLSDWGNATYVLNDHHYSNTHYLVQNAAASYFTHRKLYINDINAFTIDKPVPLEHARITTTMFGLSGSPLMFDDDFRRMDSERLKMAKLCLPRTKGWPMPVDLFDNVYPDNYSRYLKLPVETSWGSYQLVAVFNHDDTVYNAQLDFTRLGLDTKKPYCVYEFWTEEYCGTYQERFKYSIPPKSCRLFRIFENRQHPWLLSTDMHIQQGAVEVKNLQWDEKRMRLSGTATRPVGEVGNLFFLMPRRMRVTDNKGLWLLKELEDYKVIIRKEITFTKEEEDFEIFFEPWTERKYVPGHLMPNATVEEWLEQVKKQRKPGDTRVFE
ncbi:hypothetical protein DYBT9275_00530 [Dyadobacter sp. CECT 9275]|uniref:Alpha galactosidase C-terminal domain-containing protein n=1 Tax=Dyadobacter helix TaxID=2822344 RepID=A0A916NAX1_9BACT|nr:hypothetical protein [Dyadobacter sp. CECT 9275]CAG4990443.1 hypothetical protein DYBT9275_00530 [Dyadobacter sp. CECT 9275]